jgi:Uma2 family endonuclease
MDTAEFLAWDAPGNGRWQLIDGQPQAMAPASETHNIIQGELGALIRNHLVAMAGGEPVHEPLSEALAPERQG